MDISNQKNVGVMDVHNTTGDFTSRFDGPFLGESAINPSTEGVTFFRNMKGRRSVETEIATFRCINKFVRLDSVIVFGDPHKTFLDAIDIAKGVKASMPEVRTILFVLSPLVLLKNREDSFSGQQDGSHIEDLFNKAPFEFIATRHETRFWPRFEREKYAEKNAEVISALERLPTPIRSGEAFDTIVCSLGEWPERFRELMGLPEPEVQDVKMTWFFDMVEAYEKKMPGCTDLLRSDNARADDFLKLAGIEGVKPQTSDLSDGPLI